MKEGEGEGEGEGKERASKSIQHLQILPVSIIPMSSPFLKLAFSSAQANEPNHEVAQFGSGTGVSNLRKHLMKEHLEDWVKACSEKKIDITAAAALKHINEFQGKESEERDRPVYSKEAFADALVEFVVGNDIVSPNHYAMLQPI